MVVAMVLATACADGADNTPDADGNGPPPDAGVGASREAIDAGDTGPAGIDDADAGTAIADAGLQTATLSWERDRLLATVADGRCAAWASFDDTERAVFLLITDLLGKRTHLADGTSALSHVVAMHAVRGQQQEGCLRCCGDREFNRAYVSADDALMMALRNHTLPSWRDSRDMAGPHEPFTASSETLLGQPRGQAHYFANDADSVVLNRPGVTEVVDARAVEIDLDFNLVHESAPTCDYLGESGLERYQDLWCDEGDAELAYLPDGC